MHIIIKFDCNSISYQNFSNLLLQKVTEATGLFVVLSKQNNLISLEVPLLGFCVDIGLSYYPKCQMMKGESEVSYLEVITLECLREMGCIMAQEEYDINAKTGWVGKKWEEVAATYKPFDL